MTLRQPVRNVIFPSIWFFLENLLQRAAGGLV